MLGPFRVLGRLAQGATTHALRVELDTGCFVGKRLLPRFRRDAEALRQLETETRALSLLDGRGAPRLIGSGTDDEGPWLVMEELTLAPLDSLIACVAGGDRDLVTGIARPSFEALAAIHEVQVVHGDVSPGNLLVGREPPDARFIDFGLARLTDAAGTLTPGPFRGTPSFVAPEVARGEEVTAQSDLFSLGLTLLYAASGVFARAGTSVPSLLLEAGEASVLAYAESSSRGLPTPLRDTLLAVLATAPNDRPRTAREALASSSW